MAKKWRKAFFNLPLNHSIIVSRPWLKPIFQLIPGTRSATPVPLALPIWSVRLYFGQQWLIHFTFWKQHNGIFHRILIEHSNSCEKVRIPFVGPDLGSRPYSFTFTLSTKLRDYNKMHLNNPPRLWNKSILHTSQLNLRELMRFKKIHQSLSLKKYVTDLDVHCAN